LGKLGVDVAAARVLWHDTPVTIVPSAYTLALVTLFARGTYDVP
jgi:hypothetical protein